MTEREDDIIAEELEVLEAIFCQDGEFTLHDRNEGSASFTICTEIDKHVSSGTDSSSTKPILAVNFTIGSSNYPLAIPDITLSYSLLTRKNEERMKKCMLEYANEHLLGEPMVMQLMEWVQEHAHEYANEGTTSGQSQLAAEQTGELTLCLLHLDHMRAKGRYVRTLIGWSSELGIMGRILFVDKLILILLEGYQHNVKDFLLRLRTQKVDVDSSGKSCKEKMMRVLSEAPSTDHEHRFTSFKNEELDNLAMLKAVFVDNNLTELYEQHVQPLHRHSAKDSVR